MNLLWYVRLHAVWGHRRLHSKAEYWSCNSSSKCEYRSWLQNSRSDCLPFNSFGWFCHCHNALLFLPRLGIFCGGNRDKSLIFCVNNFIFPKSFEAVIRASANLSRFSCGEIVDVTFAIGMLIFLSIPAVTAKLATGAIVQRTSSLDFGFSTRFRHLKIVWWRCQWRSVINSENLINVGLVVTKASVTIASRAWFDVQKELACSFLCRMFESYMWQLSWVESNSNHNCDRRLNVRSGREEERSLGATL